MVLVLITPLYPGFSLGTDALASAALLDHSIFAAGCIRDPCLVHPRGNYDSSVGPRTRARHGARIHKRTSRCGGSDVARLARHDLSSAPLVHHQARCSSIGRVS